MAQQHQGGTYYLTEGLLIEAYPDTTRTPIPGAGGGGRDSGGCGLSQGPRRGEGGTGRLVQLTATANAVDQQEDLAPLDYQAKAAALAEKAQRIRNEQQAHFHALPSALQAAVIKSSGHASVDALNSYQTVLQNLINNQNASIRPFARVNPSITAPLTRAELDALASLVERQQSGIIGPRWKDYHLALLHGEYARHLQTSHY